MFKNHVKVLCNSNVVNNSVDDVGSGTRSGGNNNNRHINYNSLYIQMNRNVSSL